MGFMDNMRKKMQSWLQINPPLAMLINIEEVLDFQGNAIKNLIWYRGDPNELEQLYWQIPKHQVEMQKFWASHGTVGMEMRKIHTGLPALMVKVLAHIIVNDFDGVDINNLSEQDIWDNIYRNNDGDGLLKQCLINTLVVGDGAFKISIDTDISQYPIIEFYPGDKVEFVYKRGRIREIIFKTVYKHKSGIYTLHEHYGYGYVDYKLYRGESECSLNAIPQTEKLSTVTFDSSFIMAVPFKIFSSLYLSCTL